MEFITLISLKKSGETTNTAILITNQVGGRDLGLVIVFCHPDQVRIEACDALSTLCQHNLSELRVVVVRRHSNTPYIPRGTSHPFYLDMDIFSRGIASTLFPVDTLCLCHLLPFSKSEVLLPHEVGEEGLETYPHLPEFLWDSLDEEHHLSNPIYLSISLPAPPLPLEEGTQTEGGLDSHPASTQTEGGLGCHLAGTQTGGLGCHPSSTQTEGIGYHPSLELLWEANQARAQLEHELM